VEEVVSTYARDWPTLDVDERCEKYSLGEKFWYVVGEGWKYIVFGMGSLDRWGSS